MDLTPRTSPESSDISKQKRRWLPILVIVLALTGGGVVVTQFLTSAIDYYCNVDEIGVRDGCIGTRRIRIQGIVEEGSLTRDSSASSFVLQFNKARIDVMYSGDPGGIFQECVPVVAHGRMRNGVFESDRIEVKHSNVYVEKNESRFTEANKEAAACSILKD